MHLYKNSQCSTIQAVISRTGLNKVWRKTFWQTKTTRQEFRDAAIRSNYYDHIVRTKKFCKKNKSLSKILHWMHFALRLQLIFLRIHQVLLQKDQISPIQRFKSILLFLDRALLSASELELEGLWITAACGSFKIEIFNIKV